MSIGGTAASVASGAIANAMGYRFMFIVSAALSLLSVLLMKIFRIPQNLAFNPK